MSSDEIIWSGKIQTDVEDKGLPCQPKRIIYWKKIKQPMNPTKDQKIKRSKHLDLPMAWIYKEGISVSI